eukprot:2507279-Alexandrium_andersonii.AAC.1
MAADAASWCTSLEVERTTAIGDAFCAFSVDLHKCFDQVSRAHIYSVALEAGMPRAVLRPWFAMMSSMQTRNDYGHFVGAPYRKAFGIPQGDPLSMLFLCLLMRPAIQLLKTHDVCPRVLADDVFGSVSGPRAWAKLRAGATALFAFFNDVGARVSPGKSRLFANTAQLRRCMRAYVWPDLGANIPVVLSNRDLGASISMGKVLSTTTLSQRFTRAIEATNRLSLIHI